jgi:ABC-2 type transport system permease protein
VVNSIVQALFMTNADEFSELIRTGSLDFALLKPIDTQFLVSLQRIDWSSLGNLVFGLVLIVYASLKLQQAPGPLAIGLYLVYVVCGVAILYSLMMSLAASSVWLGRNQNLYDFWFYITNFSRYPREIYRGKYGDPLRWFFTFIIPVLLVINVPARFLVRSLRPQTAQDWLLPAFALVAAVASFAASRWIFNRALVRYRSASS